MTPAEKVNKINAIQNIKCAKHIKIHKLNKLGLTNKEVAEALKTNSGHVFNVLKDYKDNPTKQEKANLITA